jgi:hypothetical protein
MSDTTCTDDESDYAPSQMTKLEILNSGIYIYDLYIYVYTYVLYALNIKRCMCGCIYIFI